MAGFFKASTLTKVRKPPSLIAKCAVCGLLDSCQTPKMKPFGKGKRRVLLVGEAPGADEDREGVPFVGKAGQRLRQHLRDIGVDMDEDCWRTNANICRPPENKTPSPEQIDACRPFLNKVVDRLRPEVMILLGRNAITSFIGSVWNDTSASVNTWAGHRIPLQSHNMWVCPTWHPSYVMREGNPVLDLEFGRHLESFFELKGRPWKQTPDYGSQVTVCFDVREAASRLRQVMSRGGRIAFDYETDRLKPDMPDARIVTCAVCWEGRKTLAYPWHGEAIKATSELLLSGVQKYGWNTKFEERWTLRGLGHGVNSWRRCGMIGNHVLDHRPDNNSCKFQAFVNFGVNPWNENIEKYFQAESANSKNNIDQVDLHELLKYNGLDALLEFKLCELQEKRHAG